MRLLAEAETMRELPMAPLWYGLIALVIFAALLFVTFSFRGAANRHNPAAFHGHDGSDGHRAVTGSGH